MVPSAAGGLAGGAPLARRRPSRPSPEGHYCRHLQHNVHFGDKMSPDAAKWCTVHQIACSGDKATALVGASPIRAESAVRQHLRVIL